MRTSVGIVPPLPAALPNRTRNKLGPWAEPSMVLSSSGAWLGTAVEDDILWGLDTAPLPEQESKEITFWPGKKTAVTK